MEDCRFCEIFAEGSRTLFDTGQFFVVWDAFPVSEGHTLIISKRHTEDLFGLDWNEWKDSRKAIHRTKKYLDEKFNPDGYNVAINCGEAAGQTIFHLHIHVIPRYKGDVEDARGGVRNFKKPLADC